MRSTRLAFVFASLATLILLIGSVLLQRIVFKAAESESSLYLAPTSFSVQPSGTFELTLRSSFSIPAYVAAGQVTIRYSESQAEFVEMVPTANFTTKKVAVANGEVQWAFVPSPSHGLVAQLKGDVALGTVTFKALAESATTIEVDPSRTAISAIDPEGAYALYNAVVSTQGSVGQIAENAAATVTAPESVEELTEAPGTLQQIVRVDALSYPEQAVVLAELRYFGNLEVRFGTEATHLSQSVVSVTADTAHAIRLNGLESGQQYYYQVASLNTAGDVAAVSQVKTFTTPPISSEAISSEMTKLFAVSPLASFVTDVYGQLRDAAGGAVAAGSVAFRVSEGEAAITVADDALPRVQVRSLSGQKQKVTVETVDGDVVIAKTSLLFDPTLEQAAEPTVNAGATLPLNQNVQLAILAALAVLLTAGLIMVRLIKGR